MKMPLMGQVWSLCGLAQCGVNLAQLCVTLVSDLFHAFDSSVTDNPTAKDDECNKKKSHANSHLMPAPL